MHVVLVLGERTQPFDEIRERQHAGDERVELALRDHRQDVRGHRAQIVLLHRVAGAVRATEVDNVDAQGTAEHLAA